VSREKNGQFYSYFVPCIVYIYTVPSTKWYNRSVQSSVTKRTMGGDYGGTGGRVPLPPKKKLLGGRNRKRPPQQLLLLAKK